MKTELLALKAKLCGFEHTSRKFRKRIAKNKGMRRWSLQHEKSILGSYTREHLIAYGLLRGTPYSKIETKCDERNKPNVSRIIDIIHSHVQRFERGKWSPEKISSLLERPQP